MGVFSTGGIGIDLGSANITICLESEGVVLREPSLVLAPRDNEEDIIAVGRDARQMLGRTPKDVMLTSPVLGGAVADINVAVTLLSTLTEKAIGRRRALERSRVVVSLSQGATAVEREALASTVRATGAKRALMVRDTISAAIGAGISIGEAKGVMLVLIGSATTEICVISLNGIVASRSVRVGGNALDEAIMRYIRREKDLIIGQRTAEDLKIDIGTLNPRKIESGEEVLLRGRDAKTGKPSAVTVTTGDIHQAVYPTLEALLEGIRDAFENTPADLAGDILENGIYLSGGAAQMEGLSERLGDMLNLPTHIGEDPQDDVAIGACAIAADDRLIQRLAQTGCVLEL